jgi:hypothetical protein
MATAFDELRSFHEFVGRKLAEGGSEPPSPQECLDLWLIEYQTPEDQRETMEAIRQGLDDMDAGRTRPAEDVLRDLCRKHNLACRNELPGRPDRPRRGRPLPRGRRVKGAHPKVETT